jgi:hypothetical protein
MFWAYGLLDDDDVLETWKYPHVRLRRIELN